MIKKITLVLMLTIGLAGQSSAQLFQETFDNISGPTAGGPGTYSFPAGWVLLNADGRTPDASVSYVNEAWERREDFANDVADSAAFSTSWYAPPGPADDWMWTPPIALTTNCVLTWNGVTYDAGYPDGYEVRIWTAGGTPTAAPASSTVIATVSAENTAWTARQVSLQSLGYQNQTVRIGFRNNSNDKFLLLIDDVTVSVQNDNDVELLSGVSPFGYTVIPAAQVQPVSGTGTIRNNGLQTANSVGLQVDVYDGSLTLLSTLSSSTSTLTSGSSASFTTSTASPPAIPDFYYYDFNAVMAATDQFPSNNFLPEAFSVLVDGSTYARDNGNVSGSLGIGAGNGGYMGQSFEIVTQTYLDSVLYYVTHGYADDAEPTSAVIWSTLNGVPDQIIGSTIMGSYATNDAEIIVLPMEGGPLSLAPGTYVVTVVEYDSTLTLGTTDNFNAGSTWINWPTIPGGTWSNNEAFDFENSYVLRLILNAREICGNLADDDFDGLIDEVDPINGMIESEITGNRAVLSWNPVDGASSYQIRYRVVGAIDWIQSTVNVPEASKTYSSLVPLTSYEWQVRARVCAVWGAWSGIEQFSTICSVPEGLNETDITGNRARLRWQAIPLSTQYQVQYRAIGANTWVGLGTTTALQKRTKVLLPGTEYEWRVRNKCGITWSDWSVDYFTTLAACTPPETLATTNITNIKARMNWNAVLGAQKYQVAYSVVGSGTWVTQTVSDPNILYKTTGTLSPSTNYVWRIRVMCNSVYGAWSALVPFTTTAPGRASDLESAIEWAFTIHPNPSNGRFTVTPLAEVEGVATVMLFDVAGRTVLQQLWSANEDATLVLEKQLDNGLYILSITAADGQRFTSRVVIAN